MPYGVGVRDGGRSDVEVRDGGRSGVGWVVFGLLIGGVAQVAAFEVVRGAFVDTVRGQWLDAAALAGNSIGRGHIDEVVNTVLNAMTVVSLASAIVVIGFIALMRRRVALAAMAMLLVVGANVTTQLLKYGLVRPELGVDLERAGAGNSLPSGHTTVAVSVVVALVMVLPPALRGTAALIGAGYASLAGVATLSAGWHRPSDAVAAMLVVGAWAAVVGLALVIVDRRGGGTAAGRARPHHFPLLVLVIGGVVALSFATVALLITHQSLGISPELLGRRRLLVAYAGGAAGITGVAAVVIAWVLATVPYVVRSRTT